MAENRTTVKNTVWFALYCILTLNITAVLIMLFLLRHIRGDGTAFGVLADTTYKCLIDLDDKIRTMPLPPG